MKTKQTFEEHLRKSNLSENTITSYLWTVNYFHSRYDEVNKENLLAYKGYLMEFFKPKTVNLRIQGINKYLEFLGKEKLQLKAVKVQQKNFLENVISNADYNYLKKQLKKDGNMEWYFVVWYLAATGARVSELIQIKIEHIEIGYFDLYTKGGKLRRLYIPKKLRTETLEWMQRCCQKLLHYRTRTKNGIWETGYLFYADFALYLRGMWELFPGKNLLKTTEGCLNPAEYILNWEMKEVSNDLLERSSFIYRTYMLTSLVLWPSRISKNSCLPEEEKQSYLAGALNLIIAMSSAAELFVNIAKRFLKIFVVTDEMKTQLHQYAETVKNKVLHHYKYLCTQRIFMPASVISVIQGMIDSVNL